MTPPKILLVSTALLVLAGNAPAMTTFVFESQQASDALNNQGQGAAFTVDGLTLTTSATASEIDAMGNLTGQTVAATTTIDLNNGIGIDNPSIDNASFETLFGGDNDEAAFISSTFESLSISFDTAVIINSFNFFGVGGNETVTVVVSSEPDEFSFGSSAGSDNNEDPFGAGFTLEMGETISFNGVVDSGGAVARYSLETIVVTAVPETSSALLFGLGIIGLAVRRKRS